MKNKLNAFIAGVHALGNAIFGTCLHFLANIHWKQWFVNVAAVGKAPLALLLVPIALAIDYFKIVLAAFKIYKDNKATPSNISALIVEIIKASLSTPAALAMLGAIILSGLIGPILFVTSMGVGALYNITFFAMHVWKWQHASSPEEAYKHKLLSIKFGSAALMTTLLTVGLGLTLLGGFAAVPLLIIGISTASILLYGGVATVIIGYKIEQRLAAGEEQEVGSEQARLLAPLLIPGDEVRPDAGAIPRLDADDATLAPTHSTLDMSAENEPESVSSSGLSFSV